jgi:hypothetical protein
MGRRQYEIDPYLAMLKQSERKAIGFGFMALVAVAIAVFVANLDSQRTGLLAPVIEQIRETIGMGLLYACGVLGLVSLWFIGKYIYFLKWPEKFDVN